MGKHISWLLLLMTGIATSLHASSVAVTPVKEPATQICYTLKSTMPPKQPYTQLATAETFDTKTTPSMKETLETSLSSTLDAEEKEALMAIPTTLSEVPNEKTENEFSQLHETLPEYVVIVPTEQATFSSETAASVSMLPVKEGSLFKKGDVLIKLDCTIQDAELKKAKALQTEANMAYKSALKLKGYGTISEFELVQAVTQKDLADAEVDKLNSIVSKCIIYAPFNGSVAKMGVNLYESVKPGDPLMKVVSTDKLDFIVQIPSSWLEWLHVGSKFQVKISELNKVVDVKISKITPVINSVSQTVKIIGEEVSTKHDPALLPGMSGRATFPAKPLSVTDKPPH